jgi:hypothetical protein
MLIRPHISVIVLTSSLVLGLYGPAIRTFSQEVDGKIGKDKCLGCHGPYNDKLANKAVQFKTAEGETVMPHQYVPHDEKKDIPECTECHAPHTIPLKDKSTVVKPADLKWCYTYCHHKNNFQRCNECH